MKHRISESERERDARESKELADFLYQQRRSEAIDVFAVNFMVLARMSFSHFLKHTDSARNAEDVHFLKSILAQGPKTQSDIREIQQALFRLYEKAGLL